MRAHQATAEVFFTAFKSLKSKEKEAFLEKVLNDPELKEDIIDIALIEKAKKVKGKSISARVYFEKRRKARNAA
jgi:metal-sulfur cluster biosynthetic enzyme